MIKFRIRRKHRRILKRALIITSFLLIFIAIGILIANYRLDSEQNEAKLLLSERDSYEARSKVVEEVNQLYDYTSNGYVKLNNNKKVNILVVSDTEVNPYNRYKITTNWQEELEVSLNKKNQEENQFNNILLRGSNIMWAYMQVSSDLNRRDYDFAVIEMTNNDVKQLSSDEYKLYYEGALRQLYKQFNDIKIFVVYTDDIYLKLTREEKSLLNEFMLWTNEFNSSHGVETIKSEANKDIAKDILKRINSGSSEQSISTQNIIVNPFDNNHNLSNDLFGIEYLAGSSKLVEAEGFMISDGLVMNDASTNYLLYEVSEEFVFINYVKFNKGAMFEIYIDEILYTTIDSYSDVTGVGVLALPPNQSKRDIRIIAISEPGLRRYMMMDSLLVGEHKQY